MLSQHSHKSGGNKDHNNPPKDSKTETKKENQRKDPPQCEWCGDSHWTTKGGRCWKVFPECIPEGHPNGDKIRKKANDWLKTSDGKKAREKALKSQGTPNQPSTSKAVGQETALTTLDQSLIAVQNLQLLASSALSRDDVVWDTGCSKTSFNDPKWFLHLELNDTTAGLSGVGGSSPAMGTGTVYFETVDPENTAKSVVWTKKDVLYVPSLPASLISPWDFENDGVHYDWDSKCIVNGAKTPLSAVVWKGRVTCLDTKDPEEERVTVPRALTALHGRTPSLLLMHQRLAHAGRDRVVQACKEAGITFSNKEVKSFHCEDYMLSKSKEVISRISPNKHSKPGKFYADLIEIKPAS